MEFLAEHGVGLFDSRERLKLGLSRYAEHQATGQAAVRGHDLGPAHEHPVLHRIKAMAPQSSVRRRPVGQGDPFQRPAIQLHQHIA